MFAVLELGIDDLVELDEWGYELLPYHSLDLPCCVLKPEVVDFVLPGYVLGEFVIDGDCGVELLC